MEEEEEVPEQKNLEWIQVERMWNLIPIKVYYLLLEGSCIQCNWPLGEYLLKNSYTKTSKQFRWPTSYKPICPTS